MKKIIITFCAVILLLACKKDKDDLSLKGIWTGDSYTINDYEGSMLISTETLPQTGITYNFQNNGILVVSDPQSGDESVPYSLETDSRVIIDGEVMKIQNLTSSSVSLYFRDDYGQGDYSEIYLYLKR